MKTDRLEDFVRNNREDFNFREPSPEVWEKIAAKTNKPKIVLLHRYFARVAAVFLITVISSLLVWQSGLLSSGKLAKNISDPEIIELIEAEAYYSHQVDLKLKEIKKCYYTFPELKDEIENDLIELEDMYKTLKIDLEDNISNKSVIEAMIENNRYRLKLCDHVLDQIKC